MKNDPFSLSGMTKWESY